MLGAFHLFTEIILGAGVNVSESRSEAERER